MLLFRARGSSFLGRSCHAIPLLDWSADLVPMRGVYVVEAYRPVRGIQPPPTSPRSPVASDAGGYH